MPLVFLGRIGRPHGVAGELYVDQLSLSAEELLELRRMEWRGRGDDRRTLHVKSARATHDRMLVHFAGVPDRDAAAELVNGELWVESERMPDPGPGVVYVYQLVGLTVVDQDGQTLGVLRDVTTTTAQPLYVVERDGKEHLYPGFTPFVKNVDLAARVITMELPPGFEDLPS